MNNTVWRWFPLWLMSAMAVVFMVNVFMIYNALHTFPGEAGRDGFDLSNQYANVLATVRQQAALGWRIEADVDATQRPTLRLTNSDGSSLGAAMIDAQAERPVGPAETTALIFHPVADETFQADRTLAPGQWDLLLTVRSHARSYTATRRLVVQ